MRAFKGGFIALKVIHIKLLITWEYLRFWSNASRKKYCRVGQFYESSINYRKMSAIQASIEAICRALLKKISILALRIDWS